MSSLIFLMFISCSENEEVIINSEQVSKNNTNEDYLKEEKKFHIYYSDWDGWGRASRNCDGWGLCGYTDCWFCCTENGVVVNCNDQQRISNAGEIIIFDDTSIGYLTIKLDPDNSEHLDAINNQKVLHIDNDISSIKTTLHKGDYLFDSTIGKYGGYIVNASEN